MLVPRREFRLALNRDSQVFLTSRYYNTNTRCKFQPANVSPNHFFLFSQRTTFPRRVPSLEQRDYFSIDCANLPLPLPDRIDRREPVLHPPSTTREIRAYFSTVYPPR